MEDELLIKYIQKKCSEQELKQIHDWLAREKDHRRLFELEDIYALKVQQHYQKASLTQQAYERLQHKLQTPTTTTTTQRTTPSSSRPWKTYWAYAAMLAIICLLSAHLYVWVQHISEPAVAYHTIRVPKGQRASVTLCDGTKVWLNAETDFSYPGTFAAHQRHVILKGEAFFQVTPHKEKPFIVQLPELNIKVLGTEFNAKAYQGENHCITLREGAVEVSTKNGKEKAHMEPKDQVIYPSKGHLTLIKNAAVPSTDDWIQGELRIDNQALHEFLADMERHFDVNIHIQNASIRNTRFTCHFKSNIDIREALDLLKTTQQIDYIIDNKDVYLYPFKPKK